MAVHSRILAWRIPWTEEPGGLQSMGSQSWPDRATERAHAHTLMITWGSEQCASFVSGTWGLGHTGGIIKWSVKWRSAVSESLWPHALYSPWDSPGGNTGVGSLSLLQGTFPTQGSNLGLPRSRRILYQLSHKGSPNEAWWYVITDEN